jgi:hypothetical protein
MPNLVNLEIINDNLWMYAQCAQFQQIVHMIKKYYVNLEIKMAILLV